jgi:hypothetical protein
MKERGARLAWSLMDVPQSIHLGQGQDRDSQDGNRPPHLAGCADRLRAEGCGQRLPQPWNRIAESSSS